MRKQGERLKYISDAPLPRGKVSMRCGVEQNVFANGDFAGIRAHQPRDAIQQRGFSRAGRSKQNGDSRRPFDGDIENKGSAVATLLADARHEPGGTYFAAHRVHAGLHTRRLTAYSKQSTAYEIARRSSAR